MAGDGTREWEALVEAVVAAGSGTGSAAVRERFTAPLRPDPTAPADVESWRETMAVILPRVAARRFPALDEEPTAARAIGADRARSGAPLADLLRAVLVHLQVLGDLARSVAPASPHRERLLLEFLTLAQRWTGWYAAEVTAGHRRARAGSLGPDEDALVRRILLDPEAAGPDGGGIEAYGLGPERLYHAVRARLAPGVDAADVARYLGLHSGPGVRTGLMTVVDGDVWAFCAALPDGPPPTEAGASTAVAVRDLPDAFRRAGRALDAALATGRRDLLTLDDAGIDAAVAADHELGRLMAERYLAPVLLLAGAGEPFLSTVERYLENATRLELTARELDVHPNTVRYRLNRYEELTGCSLRDVKVVVEIWWALAWLRHGGPAPDSRRMP